MPSSLWAATAPPPLDTSRLEGEARADVAVVGAGYTGLSAALHLAEAGADVIVIDAVEPGFGASGRNGGQVIPGLKLDPGEMIARYGPERGERLAAFAGGVAGFTFDLIARLGITCEAERTGWVQAAHAPAALASASRRAEAWAARGAEVRILDGAGVAALTGTERYVGGWVDGRGGVLQPLAYARGLARAARAAGARLFAASPATRIGREGARWRVETPGGALLADQVLLATNAYTDALWPGLKRSIIPLFSYQVATRPLSGNLRRAVLPGGMPVSDTRRLLLYFRLDGEGRLVVGGRGPFRDGVAPRDFAVIRAGLAWLYPAAADTPLDHAWSGRVALTLDHVPHLHEPAPGLHICLGYNGRGVAMASACGALMAERMRGRSAADLPLPVAPVRPIPFHGLRRPALAAAVAWKRVLDRRESKAAFRTSSPR